MGTYYHSTQLSGLRRILRDNHLRTLRSLARRGVLVNAEVGWHNQRRRSGSAVKALEEAESNGKPVDSVFFTEGGYLPEYGEAVISKEFKPGAMSENDVYTMIPGESLRRGHDVSLSNATIYLPEKDVKRFRRMFPRHRFEAYSDDNPIPANRIGVADRAVAAVENLPKLFKSGSAKSDILRKYRGIQTGSAGLGLDIDGSDTDILLTYRRKSRRDRLLRELRSRYSGLDVTRDDGYKTTLTGDIDGGEYNVVVADESKAGPYVSAYRSARSGLTDADRDDIKSVKRILKHTGISPLYRWYKHSVDRRLGIADKYF